MVCQSWGAPPHHHQPRWQTPRYHSLQKEVMCYYTITEEDGGFNAVHWTAKHWLVVLLSAHLSG